MSSRSLSSAAAALFCIAALTTSTFAQTTRPGVLVVVAEPNNLPFSNQREEGFENKLARLIAREMGATLEYHWRALRRGYLREAIKSGQADLVIGVPRDLDAALTTEPYYRSSYVFVRREGLAPITSFDDPALKQLRIGIPLTGENNPPPAIALARRGIVENVVGFTVYGDYALPDPPARLINAVADREIDVAIAWGPVAGYFAKRRGLTVTPVAPDVDEPALRMTFEVSMGVARKNKALRDRVNEILVQRRDDVQKVLDSYSVPRLAPAAEKDQADGAHEHKRGQEEDAPGCCG